MLTSVSKVTYTSNHSNCNDVITQAEREVHYEKSKKDVTKWLPLVKRNRETEHLSFPLYHAQNTNQSREGISSLAVKHKVGLVDSDSLYAG